MTICALFCAHLLSHWVFVDNLVFTFPCLLHCLLYARNHTSIIVKCSHRVLDDSATNKNQCDRHVNRHEKQNYHETVLFHLTV